MQLALAKVYFVRARVGGWTIKLHVDAGSDVGQPHGTLGKNLFLHKRIKAALTRAGKRRTGLGQCLPEGIDFHPERSGGRSADVSNGRAGRQCTDSGSRYRSGTVTSLTNQLNAADGAEAGLWVISGVAGTVAAAVALADAPTVGEPIIGSVLGVVTAVANFIAATTNLASAIAFAVAAADQIALTNASDQLSSDSGGSHHGSGQCGPGVCPVASGYEYGDGFCGRVRRRGASLHQF